MGQPNERGWLTSNDIPDLDLSSFPTGSPNRVLLVVVDDTPRGRLVAGTLVETIEPLVGAIAATRACDLDAIGDIWRYPPWIHWDLSL